MISFKGRESKRGRIYKMSKNIERIYKEGKCRECRVLVTRMDFAKILGKFTKVKIQYESSSALKPNKNVDSVSVNVNSRSKCSENGITPKNSNKKQPSKALRTPKSSKVNEMNVDSDSVIPEHDESKKTHSPSNILKENNGLTKNKLVSDKSYNYVKNGSSGLKQYGIIFTSPTINNNNIELKNKLCLPDLLPNVNKSILPSEDWHIDYFPKNEEPKDDKVYDRIAAELEDLMYNEKPMEKFKPDGSEEKVEEFPSIMDILNDNITEKNPETVQKDIEQSSSEPLKDDNNLESTDVETMLLGKSNVENEDSAPISMEVDNTDVSKLIEDMDQFNNITDSNKEKNESLVKTEDKPLPDVCDTLLNPNSPSILDEALKKGIEEHLPSESQATEASTEVSKVEESECQENNESNPPIDLQLPQLDVNVEENVTDTKTNEQNVTDSIPDITNITHVVFKKMLGNKCLKSVTCPKNLKYDIELEGKPVEFIGAPKYISSIEDLQVLLQIVNESELESLYVFH